MAFEIKYSDEAKKNLDAIIHWLLHERQAGETALRWLQGLCETIDTLSEMPARCARARESKSTPFEIGNCCMAASRTVTGYTLMPCPRNPLTLGEQFGR